jgi:hypothetical protein
MAGQTGTCPNGTIRISPLVAIRTLTIYEVVCVVEYYDIMFCFTIDMTAQTGCLNRGKTTAIDRQRHTKNITEKLFFIRSPPLFFTLSLL